MKELDFLNKKTIKSGLTMPKQKSGPCGIPKEKRDTLLQKLGTVMPQTRQQFWNDLPVIEEENV